VLCLIAVGVGGLLDGGGDDRARPAGEGLAMQPLSSYRIVYRIEDLAGGERIVSTREIVVRRPFESAVEVRPGSPPGGAVQSRVVNTFGLYSSASADGAPLVVAARPGPPVGDLRLDATLPELVADGRMVRAGDARVAGRDCQLFRTREPLVGDAPAPPADAEYAEVCIDAHGLLLRERWVLAGRLTRRITAVAVEERPHIASSLFAVDADPIAAQNGGTELVAAPAVDESTWTLTPPATYRHMGSYILRSGAPSAGGIERPPRETRIDVYVSGTQLVTLEQGLIPEGTVDAPRGARRIDIPSVGEGHLVGTPRDASITLHPDQVTFVRVSGTMSTEALTRLASQLRRPR
jgi:hypothetical protein